MPRGVPNKTEADRQRSKQLRDEYLAKYREDHAEKSREYRRVNSKTAVERARAYRLKYPEKTKAQRLASAKRLALKFRTQLLEEMGAKCVQCGYDKKAALQFDHVFGDGANDPKSRAPFSRGVYEHMYASWKAGRIQLLCANCNWVKRAELQEHLAEEKRTIH